MGERRRGRDWIDKGKEQDGLIGARRKEQSRAERASGRSESGLSVLRISMLRYLKYLCPT